MVIRDRRVPGRALIAAALTVVAVATASAQQQEPTTDPKPAAKKNVVVLSGCLSGSLLTHARPKDYVAVVPDSIRITGNRAMRSRLKEANGHAVELTGVLKGLKDDSNGALIKDTGKTKIYVGGTRRSSTDEDMSDQQRLQPPTLDVSALTDVSSQCMETKSN
jgi:hypothetical protein